MALFKKDTKESKVTKAKKEVKKTSADVKEVTGDFSWVLKKPRITEKATIIPETLNAYVFQIDPRAQMEDVKKAIQSIYKVTPRKVNITKIPSKKVVRRKRTGTSRGFKSGGKKAYIYLKKGDKIEFV
ncbi:50S ribosomal protein L23 [Candidatus Nomurabacteria bacterium]|nr:50S ribosomal protein L23 [Candidatus Nomurabacteria bacterium]